MNFDEASLAFENRQGRRPFRVQPEAMSTVAGFAVFLCAQPGQTTR
jgi:hypothetical protein